MNRSGRAGSPSGPLSRRSVLAGAALAGGAAVLSGCGDESSKVASSSKPPAITIKDQRGKKLTFKHPVTRIVTLPMPAASIAIAVDRSADHVAGMHKASWTAIHDGILGEFFPDALKIPHNVAGDEFEPNVESILKLKPDVVVQWANQGSGIIEPLEKAGLTVLGVKYGTQDDLDTWLKLFSAMLGKPDRGKDMIDKADATRRDVTERTKKVAHKAPKILYFNRFSGGLKVAGHGTYNDYYIKLIGGHNPAGGDHGVTGMDGVEAEQVLDWDPDIILLGNFDDAKPGDVYHKRAWRTMSAVRKHRVYKVPLGGYRWDPPSHESPLMWQWLSDIAFPHKGTSGLRDKVTKKYKYLYDHTPSAQQLDQVLRIDVNKESANYRQFDAA
jgi:iron complex transport system substrate-binding protein